MRKFTTLNGFAAVMLLGGLFPPQLSAADNLRDNIVVILDASGSMKHAMRGSGRQKMEVAKEALREVLLGSVKETTNLGVLVFSAANLKSDVLYPLGPVDRAKLQRAIMLPEPGHGTPLGTYLKKGADLLLTQREKQEGYGTYRLLVVTDGEASDKDLVDRHLPDILSRGITLDVIGVDMRSNHALATRVHSYRRADEPEALAAAISEVFAEIGGANDEDVPGGDAFTLLETIPDELASAMLSALTETRNDPIGAPRKSPAAPDSTARSTPAATPRTSPPPAPPPVNDGGGDDDGGAGWPAVFVFLIIVLVATKRVRKFGRR